MKRIKTLLAILIILGASISSVVFIINIVKQEARNTLYKSHLSELSEIAQFIKVDHGRFEGENAIYTAKVKSHAWPPYAQVYIPRATDSSKFAEDAGCNLLIFDKELSILLAYDFKEKIGVAGNPVRWELPEDVLNVSFQRVDENQQN